jgi:RNA recognition motif-containing protein
MNLFVANFDEDVTEGDLDELFRDYGKVTNARICTDFETGKSRGFGFVEMKGVWEAERAIEELDGKRWRGKYLKVSEARNQKW